MQMEPEDPTPLSPTDMQVTTQALPAQRCCCHSFPSAICEQPGDISGTVLFEQPPQSRIFWNKLEGLFLITQCKRSGKCSVLWHAVRQERFLSQSGWVRLQVVAEMKGLTALSLCRVDGDGECPESILRASCGRIRIKGHSSFCISFKRCYLTLFALLQAPYVPLFCSVSVGPCYLAVTSLTEVGR